jgi:hypothetical protein
MSLVDPEVEADTVADDKKSVPYMVNSASVPGSNPSYCPPYASEAIDVIEGASGATTAHVVVELLPFALITLKVRSPEETTDGTSNATERSVLPPETDDSVIGTTPNDATPSRISIR